MRFACWITKATHSQYVTLFAQQQLGYMKAPQYVFYTRVAYLVFSLKPVFSNHGSVDVWGFARNREINK